MSSKINLNHTDGVSLNELFHPSTEGQGGGVGLSEDSFGVGVHLIVCDTVNPLYNDTVCPQII